MTRCSGTYNILGNFAHLNGACEHHHCSEDTQSETIIYNGPNLPCTEIHTCDDLNVILQKIDDQLCTILTTLYNLTTTTTTTTIIP